MRAVKVAIAMGLLAVMAMGQMALAQGKSAAPAERPRKVIFIFNWSETHWVTGNIVPLTKISAILFLEEPCPLEFAGSIQMHRAWHFADVGCWAPTADDGYEFASSVTGDIRNIPGPMEYMLHGEVQPSGSVLITEPEFDSTTFPALAARRVAAHQIEKMRRMRDSQP